MISVTVARPEPTPFWSALFTDRRIAPALGLGFTSGIPFLLVYSTQSAWLSDVGISLAIIGLLSELTLAYKFKFLWAPFLDRYDPPLFGRALGRRRGWIIVAQLGVMATLAGVALGDPAHRLAWTIVPSLALGVAGATLDLVIDGWRITSVRPPEKQAVLSSWTEIGWRIGNLAAGAGALFLADRIGWRGAYLCMGALMLPGMAAAIIAPEPASDRRPHLAQEGFVETVWSPIRELLIRLGPTAPVILLLVAGFRMPGYIASAMAVPLFKHQGFANTDIATVTKLFGFWIALGGTFAAGALIPRIGMLPSLLIGTVAGSASHLSLAYLTAHGGDGGDRILDLRRHGQHRRLRLRFRVSRADHLHVDARLGSSSLKACSRPRIGWSEASPAAARASRAATPLPRRTVAHIVKRKACAPSNFSGWRALPSAAPHRQSQCARSCCSWFPPRSLHPGRPGTSRLAGYANRRPA